MKMVSMKLKKPTKGDMPEVATDMDYSEKYPYGLIINLGKDQVDKMPGIKNCKVGETVNLAGSGKVISVRMTEGQNRSSHNVEIQIEKIAVDKKKSLEQMNQKEYNNARKHGKDYL